MAEVELEFTAEGVREGFGGDPFMASLLGETTPEEFAAFLNDAFDQSDRKALYAMFTDHEVELEIGGEASIREMNGFEEWADRTDFDPEGGEE